LQEILSSSSDTPSGKGNSETKGNEPFIGDFIVPLIDFLQS
jgi:hypothetical protein